MYPTSGKREKSLCRVGYPPSHPRHNLAQEMSNLNCESELAAGNREPNHIVQLSQNELREKLVQQADARPLISVDLDDVLCQTTACVAHCALVLTQLTTSSSNPLSFAGHNHRFGTDMQIKDFYCQSDIFPIVVISSQPTQIQPGIKC